jgi:hypothetical protein
MAVCAGKLVIPVSKFSVLDRSVLNFPWNLGDTELHGVPHMQIFLRALTQSPLRARRVFFPSKKFWAYLRRFIAREAVVL